MKRIVSLFIVFVFCLGTLTSCMPNLKKYAIKYAEDKAVVRDDLYENEEFLAFLGKMNSFALSMTASISNSNKPNNNYCISPVSIYNSLAIACECSAGETRQEILDALGVTYEEMQEYSKYYYALFNKEYKYIDSYNTEHVSAHEKLANSIWLDVDVKYNDSCVHELAGTFNTDVFSIPFADGTAENIINQYIDYKTHNVVKGNVKLPSGTDFSILSLYHLKEIWNEFGRALTISLESYEFTNTDKSTVTKNLIKSSYTPGKVFDGIKYSSFYIETEHGYKLHFIMPKSNYYLEDVFTSAVIKRVLSKTDYGFIDDNTHTLNYTRIIFPEVEVSYSGNISDNLKNDFAITSLFDKDACDFSGLTENSVHCNNFIHATRAHFDAKGIEGATIDLGQSGTEEPELPDYEEKHYDFVINRAFGFVLTDAEGLIVYAGEVNSLK